jgi:hypothetical protein
MLHRQLAQRVVGPEASSSEYDDWPETDVEQVAAVKLAIILVIIL